MSDWREDGQAAHEYELMLQEREEWLADPQAQAEYKEILISQHKEAQNEVV